MRINNNIAAFNAYRNLQGSTNSLSKSLAKLSSGYRINSAADDAAGLVKSESLRAEIGGSKVAVRNAQDGVSFVQTAEGALNEVHSILQRMRDLAVSASNTATTDGAAQQAEFDELEAEITAIGSRTQFAGSAVFQDYSTTGLNFHVGAGSGDNLQINDDLALSASDVFNVDLTAVNLETAASTAIDTIDSAIAAVSDTRSTLGATQNRLEHTINNLQVAVENLSASESRVRDTDMAAEMVNFTRAQILQQAGTAMLAQANTVPQSVLRLLG